MDGMTLTEIGALVGFITGVFTVWDRFAVGRPMILIEKTNYKMRDLKCVNLSKEDVILTRIRVLSKHVLVSAGESPQQMAEGLLRTPFMTIIPAGGQATFPIVVKDGALMDDDCRDVVPFIIVVSWRKTRAMWLPQPPKFLFSSVRALRRLNRAKTGQRPSAKA
jgi:hypothetical protein